MKIPRPKDLNFRTKVYAGICILGFVSVVIRIGVVNFERGRPIVNFASEWAKHGKPVIVKGIKQENIPVFKKFTVTAVSDKAARGFVTADVAQELKENQEIYSAGDNSLYGKISKVSMELDIDTGMFPIEVELNNAVSSGSRFVVFAKTHNFSQAIAVPNEILDISGDDFYLWKAENAKAKRIKVSVGSRNGYGAIITEGIQQGDLVIFSGQSQLKDNDQLNIISRE